MTNTQFQFTRNFYKLFYEQERFLDSFAPEPLYLQTLAEISNTKSIEDRRQLISSLQKHIQHKRRQLAHIPALQLLNSFLTNLDYCEQLLIQDRREFLQRINSLNNKSYQLRHITSVQIKVDSTTERYEVVLRNIANLRHIYNIVNVKKQLKLHYDLVSKLIDLNLLQSSKMSSSRDDVSSNGSRGYQQRVKEEVRKKQLSIRVPSEEMQTLKHQLFDSSDSLATKQRVSRQNIEMKTKVAKSQMRTISDLELSIMDMQRKMDEINDAKLKASQELEQKKCDMSGIILDIVRLNSLIDSLSREISAKVAEVSAKLSKLDKERERILNDPNLTEAERAKMLTDIDNQVAAIKAAHSSDIELLESHKSGLNLEIESALKNEIEEMERSKVGKTSSECMRIDEKIRLLQNKLSEVTLHSRVYLDGEFGKYYIGPNGEKIFKSSSLASEYMEIDGKLVKVRSAIQLLFDDAGDFYFDAAGNKVYVKSYAVDEIGRYYIDSDGNKIYKASPYATEFKLENGQLVQVKSASCLLWDENGDYFLDGSGKKIYLVKYETDEFGRYYVDSEGNRVYKSSPYAAEYKMIDGKLVKVKSAMCLFFDETGDYFFDSDGNKVYVQKYEMDEVGRYYIDANGNRIYKADPYAAEYQVIDGVLTMVKEGELTSQSSQESVATTQTHFEYVKEHLGKALRRALAATIVHQPSDPINFIANHLLKQRHAELANVVRQIEEQTIREERERVVLEEEQLENAPVLDPCNPCAQYV